MADYTPLLTRAVAGQDEAARAAIYARAREALERQLRGYEPKLSEEHIEGELAGLLLAIETVEANVRAQEPGPAPVPAPAPVPVVEPVVEAAPEPAAATEPVTTPEPPAPEAATPPLEEATPAPGGPDEAEVLKTSSTDDVTAPTIEPVLPMSARPRMPLRDEAGKSRKPLIMAAGAALIVMVGMAGLALTRRAAPDPLRAKGQTQETAAVDASKTEGRLAAEAPPRPSEPQTAAPSSEPPRNLGSEAVTNTSTRAFMVLESPGDAPSQFEGRSLWSFEPDPASKGEKSLRTIVAFPGADLTIDLSLSRNKDASLGASHLMMVIFEAPKGTEPIREMSPLEWRERESQTGTVMEGNVVPVQDNAFMVALEKNAEARNLDLLRMQKWMVFEFRLANGRRGAVLVEKGGSGEKASEEALAAWK